MLKQESANMADFEYLVSDVYSMDSANLDELGPLGTFNSQGNLVVLSPPDVAEAETLDIAYVMPSINVPSVEDTMPVSPRGPPARTSFPGGLNFSVEINAADTNRKKYLYSHQLNRIYVDIKTNFPVQFRWDFDQAGSPMFVRATTVFSDEAQSEKRVERCLQHTHESTNAGIDPTIVQNVLHSSAAPGTQGVFYCGAPSLPDSWYSVLLRFDGRPQEPYSHAYQFVCKNSCSSGINRRSIDIIFTLEDHTGLVYGRQTVGARVCACPRRDKHKDEAAERPAHKRRLHPPPHTPHPAGKKVKTEPDDDVLVLPPLPIVGRRTMVTGLEVMLNMMEAVAAKTPEHEADKYQSSIRALRDKIQELRQAE
ncbi:cellular tumor antigen p53 [Leguminivora glycinivorella]|uniref:cellular tumor antigen p53 n=1 Tax=Leguminivora glycinivorella TaxID=1035111 RepID=UPI00200D65C6|nr:cellular tumor antigen p53 [Leguminivora glycinivorella]